MSIIKAFKSVLKLSFIKLKNPTLICKNNVKINNVKLSKYNLLCKGVLVSDTQIGEFSYIGENSIVRGANIGKFTCIGPDVKIGGIGDHPTNTFVSVHPVFYSTKKQVGISFVNENLFNEHSQKVTIGNDVWIGANVIITKSISIGDGAIIAAGSVVTKEVKPYEIVGGVPAKNIKYRFNIAEINFLLAFKWWDRDIEWLKSNVKLMSNISSLMNN